MDSKQRCSVLLSGYEFRWKHDEILDEAQQSIEVLEIRISILQIDDP